MTDAPIIQADFVKPQPVPSRKVLQLVFEVPEEAADHAMAVLGGFPQSGKNRWCAIARLADETTAESAAESLGEQTAPAAVEDAPKLKGGAQAKMSGILCGTAAFQDFLRMSWKGHWQVYDNGLGLTAEDIAACVVRRLCLDIESRAELDHNEPAGRIWDQIESDFRAAQQGRTDPEVARQRAAGPS